MAIVNISTVALLLFLMVAFNCFFVVDRLLIAVGSFFIRWLYVCVCVFLRFSAKAYFTRKINERRRRRQRRSEEKTFQLNWMNDKKLKLAHYFEKFFWKTESFLQSCLRIANHIPSIGHHRHSTFYNIFSSLPSRVVVHNVCACACVNVCRSCICVLVL